MVLINSFFFSILFSIILIGNISINEPLYFSNYPESITYPQKIFSEITNLDNVRFHYYHQNKTTKALVQSFVITNNENSTANLKVININNTNFDGSKLSFKNSKHFWTSIIDNKLKTIQIGPKKMKEISKDSILPNDINHGIVKIVNPEKNTLKIDLTYKGPIYSNVPLNQIKPVIFEEIIKKEIIVLPDGPKVIIPIGHKDHPKYSYNHGNYGQIHELNIKFINPYDYPLKSTLYFHRISGMSRNNIVIDDIIYQTKYILLKNPIEKIKEFAVLPNSTPTHQIKLFPESGNFYPIEIIISSLKETK